MRDDDCEGNRGDFSERVLYKQYPAQSRHLRPST